jgi:hypothetical protein
MLVASVVSLPVCRRADQKNDPPGWEFHRSNVAGDAPRFLNRLVFDSVRQVFRRAVAVELRRSA